MTSDSKEASWQTTRPDSREHWTCHELASPPIPWRRLRETADATLILQVSPHPHCSQVAADPTLHSPCLLLPRTSRAGSLARHHRANPHSQQSPHNLAPQLRQAMYIEILIRLCLAHGVTYHDNVRLLFCPTFHTTKSCIGYIKIQPTMATRPKVFFQKESSNPATTASLSISVYKRWYR